MSPRARGGLLAATGGAVLLPLALTGILPGGTAHAPSATAARPAPPVVPEPERRGRRALSILQIGDSHTAADLFTDAARQRLQERHGVGAPGNLPVGSPHPGIRSSVVKVSASPGWTYESLQRSATPETFGLSGYNASTRGEGETLTVSAEGPTPYALVEIEARTGPGQGAIAVEIDGAPVRSAALESEVAGPRVIRLRPPGGTAATFRRLVIRTMGARPVTISGLAVRQPDAGLTYDVVGYPGATVEILDKLPARTLADALARSAPDVIVLAFGTNEGFNDTLDLGAYRERYASVLRRLRAGAPRARLVMIGPPQAERVAPPCKPAPDTACVPPAPSAARADGPAASEPTISESRPSGSTGCPRQPPRLAAVREAQRTLAREEGVAFWDWWALMPSGCGAGRWAGADPPLMAKDHVHFTRAGYRVSGRSFADFLEPRIGSMLRGDHAVSNH